MGFTQEKAEKLESILKNEEFIGKANELVTAEELQALIAAYGLDLAIEDVVAFCELVAKEKKRIDANSNELSEGDLEGVTGGGFLFIAGCVGLGVLALGGLVCGLINGYKGNS